jgi:lactoylglutathione lyase
MGKSQGVFKFDHVHIKCHDVNDAEKFYREMFNAETVDKFFIRNTPGIMMKLGDSFISLVNAEKDEVLEPPKKREASGFRSMIRYGLGHFGVRVRNLDEVARALREKGAEFLMEPQEGSRGGGKIRIAFIRGPEDDAIEIVERND